MECVNPSLIRSASSSETATADSRKAQSIAGSMGGQWEGFSVSVPCPSLHIALEKQGLQPISPSTNKELQSQPSCSHTSGRDSRQARVQFSDDVRKVLEVQFEENPYPDQQKKEELSQCTHLTMRQVTTWFNNKRANAKKQHQKERLKAAQLADSQHLQHPTLSTVATISAGPSAIFGTGSLIVGCPSVLHSEDANLEFPVPYGKSASQEALAGQCGTSSLTGDHLRDSSAVLRDKSSDFVKIFGQWVKKPPIS